MLCGHIHPPFLSVVWPAAAAALRGRKTDYLYNIKLRVICKVFFEKRCPAPSRNKAINAAGNAAGCAPWPKGKISARRARLRRWPPPCRPTKRKRNFPLDFARQIRYNNMEDKPVCRNGRRGGLKIPCANHTCGFDPHHRHQCKRPGAEKPRAFCCPAHGNSLRAAMLQKQNPEPKFRVFYFKWTVQDSNL